MHSLAVKVSSSLAFFFVTSSAACKGRLGSERTALHVVFLGLIESSVECACRFLDVSGTGPSNSFSESIDRPLCVCRARCEGDDLPGRCLGLEDIAKALVVVGDAFLAFNLVLFRIVRILKEALMRR